MPSLTPESRSQLLSHLRADQSERWQRGERVRVEHYLAQYPDLASDAEAQLDLVHFEVLYRLESGERPALDEYLQRFPQHANALRSAWAQLRMTHRQLWSESGEPYSTVPEERDLGPLSRPAAPALSLPGLEIHEKLGEGGMGVVYRARDVRLDQPRAIKVIRRGPFAGGEAHERFAREAKAVARLDHAGVVRLYSLGEHEGALYICMELLEGGSLQARLRQGRLEVRAAANLVRQVALAVQHAHENRVVHRDLKPANVLLTADGAPKVGDFGLAKLLDIDDDLTYTGAVMGTPSYMAPEQAEGRLADVGERTDVWALGAILYEGLTGQQPFKGKSRSETLESVKKSSPASLRQLRPEVPAELEAVCLKCLEKQPDQRYASAAGLAADLQAWLDGKATRTQPARRLRRLWRGVRRRPRLTLLAGFVLLAGMTAGLFWHFTHPDRPLRQTQAQLRRGEPVELLGATGKPRWSRWWMGEKDAKALVEEDGTFVVHGWPLTLLELLPDTCGHSHYRIHAEVRHVRTGEHGAVGLYFAGTTHRREKGPVRSFLQVCFNDLQDEVDQYNRLPPALQKLVPVPRGNRVQVASCYARGDGRGRHLTNSFLEPALFKAIGNSGVPGDWRTIRVEVSPTRARVFWDDKLVGELGLANMEEVNEKALATARRGKPADPALEGIDGRMGLRGSIGLYLFTSYASFRNVRVVPRDSADEND